MSDAPLIFKITLTLTKKRIDHIKAAFESAYKKEMSAEDLFDFLEYFCNEYVADSAQFDEGIGEAIPYYFG